MEINDETGKKLKAIKVFSYSIRFLKDDLIAEMNRREKDVKVTDQDIHWVLTVPAIWNDDAKQFMREAAEQVIYHELLCFLLLLKQYFHTKPARLVNICSC